MTATATCGRSAGAKATNQASASRGSDEFGRSSAVPVFPATVTPGSAPEVPVPERTTSTIIERTWLAARRETARRRITLSRRAMRGTARRPSAAIVAATLAIASGVARSFSCPIAAEPTARSSSRAAARETVLRLAAGSRGASPNPNARAAATSRRAPSLAPSGAKTELHDSANDCWSVPPHASPPALRSVTPESVAPVCTG